MDLLLSGHRALVTGSSSGIGEAIARRLAAEGASGVVHGRRAEAVHSVVDSIRSRGGDATGALANLADAGDIARLVNDALANRPVDIVVNNAAAFVNRGWDDASPEDWLELYAINVAAVVRVVHGLLPSMRLAGWGRIIQMGTGEAINPFAFMPDYAATKAAILNLTVSLAKHLDRTGITANTVSPGIVVTPGVEQFYRQEASRPAGETSGRQSSTAYSTRSSITPPAGSAAPRRWPTWSPSWRARERAMSTGQTFASTAGALRSSDLT